MEKRKISKRMVAIASLVGAASLMIPATSASAATERLCKNDAASDEENSALYRTESSCEALGDEWTFATLCNTAELEEYCNQYSLLGSDGEEKSAYDECLDKGKSPNECNSELGN